MHGRHANITQNQNPFDNEVEPELPTGPDTQCPDLLRL